MKHTKIQINYNYEFSKCTGPITSINLPTNNARNPMPNRTTRPCPCVGQRRCHFICAYAQYKISYILFESLEFWVGQAHKTTNQVEVALANPMKIQRYRIQVLYA